jgi:hypothetical protein
MITNIKHKYFDTNQSSEIRNYDKIYFSLIILLLFIIRDIDRVDDQTINSVKVGIFDIYKKTNNNIKTWYHNTLYVIRIHPCII